MDIGINFRGNAGTVTDGPNQTYCLGEAYPTTRGGFTFGWSVDLTANGRDRDYGVDVRLQGLNFTNTVGHYFQLDLPSTGTYDVRVAAGDAVGGGNGDKWDIQDNSTVLASLTTDFFASILFGDATDTNYSAANWPGSNTKLTSAFSSTVFKLQSRAASTANNVIAHIQIVSVASAAFADEGLLIFPVTRW